MKAVITDYVFENIDPETEALRGVAEVLSFRQYPGAAEFLRAAGDVDGIITNMAPMNAEVIEGLSQCKVIVRYGVGVDNIDIATAARRGIPVCNVPDYCTPEVADHTLTLILGLVRKLPYSVEYLRAGNWNHNPLRPVRRLSSLTLGLYGFGRIARSVAERARAFGFTMIAYDPFVPDAAFAEAGVERVSSDDLLARTDVLSLHMPLMDTTRHLLNADSLAKMKPGSFVVNTARGGLIDIDALMASVQSGHTGGAALDVLEKEPIPADHPVLQIEKILVTPHLAWYSEEALTQLQRSVGEICAHVLRGGTPPNVVNPDYRQHAG